MKYTDLRVGGTRPPGVQILSISCSFGEIWQNRMLAPPGGDGVRVSGYLADTPITIKAEAIPQG